MAKKNNSDYNNLLCLDIFLASLTNAQYKKIAHRIQSSRVFPSMSWGVFADPLKAYSQHKLDISQLDLFAKKYNWNFDAATILKKQYEALVITDLNQEILWVNDGFEQMTGYDSEYAIGKTPKFLQGKNTSAATRKRIKIRLSEKIPFTEVILNYRKNTEVYLCEVTIIPIHTIENEVTHFIAFEKAV